MIDATSFSAAHRRMWNRSVLVVPLWWPSIAWAAGQLKPLRAGPVDQHPDQLVIRHRFRHGLYG
ncbi:hypothetical protein OHA79_49060 (plasmid) [Streptomyces sp. NBC_00841]|uniref:hypothetical protein n=1 Tax=Streptomyces sp. NBC_01669 TaxID=2975909 RepID=UPI00225737AB|nr:MULTISPECIES: hypothetical protein [unclassified Streptomyces]MCX4538728.1 hypothetical protein [Streptomyces sp. NBC_01669]WSA05465.1 hypothetical protein OHA79_49060 [Streptomyces sp. NBC_00841]